MGFKIDSVHLNDVKVVLPEVRGDARGFFMESFNQKIFSQGDVGSSQQR